MRRATNWALDEKLNKSNLKDVPKDFHPIIERRHFNLVLEKDIKAAFGAADDALTTYHREGIFQYGPRFETAVQELHAAAQLSEAVPKSTILLQGALLGWSLRARMLVTVRRVLTIRRKELRQARPCLTVYLV